MSHIYRYYLLLLMLILQACSGDSSTSGPVDPAANLPRNANAIETCYDLSITINNNRLTKNICTTIENGGENGLGVSKLTHFKLNTTSNVFINVSRTSGLNPSDPDLILYKRGEVFGFAETSVDRLPNQESLSTRTLGPGSYVIEVREFTYFNTARNVFYKTRGQQKSYVVNQQQATSTSPCSATGDGIVRGNTVFDRVNFSGVRLNYNDITQEPIQQAMVQVICNGFVYSTSATDANGNYAINFPLNQASLIRVSARMLKNGSWDFSVVDNALATQPLYTMESRSFNESANFVLNLGALSGWNSATSSYASARVAAPFAILDSVRKAKDKVLSVANVSFPSLKINWSQGNSPSTIEGTLYDGEEIFLMGAENVDTDEYDEHVVIHEWAHYFESQFSRSDSIGGTHTRGDILDIRLAFGEGFGNAFSAMVMDDPVYKDTSGNRQSKTFSFGMDANICTNPGWFSECSVHSVLFDIYDISGIADSDNVSLGLEPIVNVMMEAQKNTVAMTSIFSFIKALKDQNINSANDIDTLLFRQGIDTIQDVYGGSQLSLNPGDTDQLPVYESF